MYSTGDSRNYTYSIGKNGKVFPVDSAFCSTRQFGLGSNTKMLTALLALQMVEAGQLHLEDSLAKIVQQVEVADMMHLSHLAPPPPAAPLRSTQISNLLLSKIY